MNAPEILQAGIRTLQQRGEQRDKPEGERSMPAIVQLFETLTGHELTERDGWLFMTCLKLVRMQTGAPDRDHFIDGANYIALAGEAALRAARFWTDTPEPPPASMYSRPDPCAPAPMPEDVTCRACDGTGNCAIDKAKHYTRCRVCGGLGTRQPDTAERPRGQYSIDAAGNLSGPRGTHNIMDVAEGICPICCGTGRACDDGDDLCPTCGGTGGD